MSSPPSSPSKPSPLAPKATPMNLITPGDIRVGDLRKFIAHMLCVVIEDKEQHDLGLEMDCVKDAVIEWSLAAKATPVLPMHVSCMQTLATCIETHLLDHRRTYLAPHATLAVLAYLEDFRDSVEYHTLSADDQEIKKKLFTKSSVENPLFTCARFAFAAAYTMYTCIPFVPRCELDELSAYAMAQPTPEPFDYDLPGAGDPLAFLCIGVNWDDQPGTVQHLRDVCRYSLSQTDRNLVQAVASLLPIITNPKEFAPKEHYTAEEKAARKEEKAARDARSDKFKSAHKAAEQEQYFLNRPAPLEKAQPPGKHLHKRGAQWFAWEVLIEIAKQVSKDVLGHCSALVDYVTGLYHRTLKKPTLLRKYAVLALRGIHQACAADDTEYRTTDMANHPTRTVVATSYEVKGCAYDRWMQSVVYDARLTSENLDDWTAKWPKVTECADYGPWTNYGADAPPSSPSRKRKHEVATATVPKRVKLDRPPAELFTTHKKVHSLALAPGSQTVWTAQLGKSRRDVLIYHTTHSNQTLWALKQLVMKDGGDDRDSSACGDWAVTTFPAAGTVVQTLADAVQNSDKTELFADADVLWSAVNKQVMWRYLTTGLLHRGDWTSTFFVDVLGMAFTVGEAFDPVARHPSAVAADPINGKMKQHWYLDDRIRSLWRSKLERAKAKLANPIIDIMLKRLASL